MTYQASETWRLRRQYAASRAELFRLAAAIERLEPPAPRAPRELDQMLVEALVAGHRYTEPLRRERREAARILLRVRPDLTKREIAERVGVCRKTVERIKPC